MYKKPIKILAIESSCDETAAAIIDESKNSSPVISSNIVSSQIDLHAKTGGVVPEVASRAHMEAIIPVIEQALSQVNSKFIIQNLKFNLNSKLKIENSLKDVTHIAVTAGPGLIGSLLVGFNTAKALAYSLNIPIIPINHIEGHIYSALAESNSNIESRNSKQIQNQNNINSKQVSDFVLRASNFPLIALTVSGGHTSLTLMKDHGVYENIGSTLDDAAGEAFDKVAKLLDLGYPGGPAVSKLAEQFRNSKEYGVRSTEKTPSLSRPTPSITFPRPILNDGTFNFSFSGLKTAVLTKVKKMTENGSQLTDDDKAELCAAFEDAVVDVLVTKTLRAAEKYQPKAVILAGGVAANKRLREELSGRLSAASYQLILPPAELCGDNAAMIGVAAYYHILKNNIKTWNEISVDSNLKL